MMSLSVRSNSVDCGLTETRGNLRLAAKGVAVALFGVATLLLSTRGTEAAVSFSATANAAGGAVGSLTYPLTIPAGTNRAVIVSVQLGSNCAGASPTVTSVTYAGVGLTRITSILGTPCAGTATRSEQWRLVAPATGTNNVVVTLSAATAPTVHSGAMAFAGVDQANPIRAFNSASGVGNTSTVTVTSALGDMVVNTVGQGNSITSSGQTQRFVTNTSASNTLDNAGGSTAPGAAPTVTMTWAFGASDQWQTISSSLQAAVIGYATGSFTKSNAVTTQTIQHGLGQTPKAIILWTTFAYGMSDGTTSKSVAAASQDNVATSNASRRIANKVLTLVAWGEVTIADADLGGGACAAAWDTQNFCLNWTANTAATGYVVHFIAIGGAAVQAKVLSWTMPNGVNAAYAVNGVTTFQPNMVIHAHVGSTVTAAPPTNATTAVLGVGVMDGDGDQWATALYTADAAGSADTQRGQQTDAAIYDVNAALGVRKKASFVSMNATGFTMNFSTSDANQGQVISLALAGINGKAGNFTKNTLVPQFVQQNAGKVAVAANAQTLGAVSTSGNLIIVTLNYDGAATISTVADTKGNTYSVAVPPTAWGPGATYHTATYYASNIIGGGTAITVTGTLSGAPTSFYDLYVLEYSGVAAVNPLDQISAAANTGLTWNSGAKTTTQASELIYGFSAGSNDPAAKGASFTMRSTWDANMAEDKVVAATGSYSADGTYPLSNQWVAHMATFRGVTTSQPITGVDFQPEQVLLTSFQDVRQASPTVAVVHGRFGIGASDGVTEGSSAFGDQNAVTPTNVDAIDKITKAFIKYNSTASIVDAEADLTSMDVDGFTLNWTTNDAVQTQILYLAWGTQNVTEVRLLSFDATKYDRGVLLQWRTGREIDNLGFNLYREVNGVRRRVNAGLIAGSGLMAGHGTAVDAVQSYARWDLDADATSGHVVYWLEDLDFSGVSAMHGPITPVLGALNTTPDVAQSTDLTELRRSAQIREVFLEHGEADPGPVRQAWSAQPQSQTGMQWELAGHAAVKIGVRAPGWYRVSQTDLLAAGLDPGVDPLRLRLFVGGVEQAMRVIGEGDGRFDSGDAIEFYATGVDTAYTETQVYWLAAGFERGQRIEVAVGPGRDAVSTSVPASFWLTAHRKDRSVFFAALKNGDKENWFGPLVSAEPTELTIVADNIDHSPSGSAQLEVTLQGVTSNPDGSAVHSVSVLVNGAAVGDMTFAGQENAVQVFPVPTSVLIDGQNTVTFIARGGETDYSLVDLIRLGYSHTYRADADLLRFTVDPGGPVTIGGFASSAIHVVDITDPSAPTELHGTIGSEVGGFSSVMVRVQALGPRTLLAFSEATVSAPAWIQPNRPSTWHARTQTHNWVAISHSDFIEQVKPLASLREYQGYRTAVIDVEDLYDEFSFGEKTPQALRDFLQFAKANWREAPRFVVLAGDATIDPRDYAELGGADFVPTKRVPMAHALFETASDDWFVDFNDDGLPDVPVGRLSVRTADQAAAMVAKIVNYDENSQAPWTKRVLLVADQNGDTVNFEHYSTDLADRLPSDYTAQQVFRGVLGDALAHQSLIDAVNDGQLIVNYVGHGSSRIWGGNGELLTSEDVTSLLNGSRLPFVVAMNCLNGLFDAIWDEESLGEAWLRAPAGGAVAAWASSGVTPASTQAAVNKELFRLIFQGAYATLGEAVVASKRVVLSPDMRRSWIFFGDPAMRLSGVPLRSGSAGPPAAEEPSVNPDPAPDPPVPTHPEELAVNALLDARGGPVRLRDFNGDARADLLMYVPGSGRWVAVLNDAAGISLRDGSWDPAWQLEAANLNGDSRADVIFYKRDTSEWVQAPTTAAGPSPITRGTLPGGAPGALARVGDFDGDHLDDLLMYDAASGNWTIGVNDGLGGFTSRRGTWPSGLRIQVADFNRDGLADAFGYDAVTGQGSLMLSSPDGRFVTTTDNFGSDWRVTVANAVGNNYADLLFYNPSSGAWQAAINDGLGHFSVRTGRWAAGLEIHSTDLDGDGRDDVFGYNPATGEWLTALNLAPGQFAAVDGGSWTPGLSIATGDVNADGRDDIVLYDSGTGIWFEGFSVSPGVFVFGSGIWLPGGSLVGGRR